VGGDAYPEWVRSALLTCLLASLAASAALVACAPEFQGETDGFDRGEASAAPRSDGGSNPGSSSGGTTPPRDGGNALLPDGAVADTGTPSEPPCDPQKGVGEIVDVPGLVNASDYRAEARLSLDELHVVFTQVRDPNAQNYVHDLYVASRATRNDAFGNIKPVPFTSNVFTAALGTDGLSLYFTPKDAGPNNGVQYTTRATGDADFAAPSVVAGVPQYSYDPFVTADGRLLFAIYPDAAPATIQSATLAGGTISGMQTLFGVAGTDVDYASLSSDGTELFYTAYQGSNADAAFRRATRQGDGSYAGATALGGLDEQNQEVTWVSPDACRVYMTDWRGYTLRMAKRLP
jgi:hypothetical protein